jgi:N-acetylglutamate synthase-like GNAT family acetyltransferase
MQIKEIKNNSEKTQIWKAIYPTIPDWFGQDTSNKEYEQTIKACEVFTAYHETNLLGFIALKYHFTETAEIFLMAIYPKFHRKGIGKKLFQKARSQAIVKLNKVCILKTKDFKLISSLKLQG